MFFVVQDSTVKNHIAKLSYIDYNIIKYKIF